MNIDALIQFASEHPLDSSTVQGACEVEGKSVRDLFDSFAEKIAKGYLSRVYSWQFGDSAMNSLFSYAYAFSDEGLSAYAWSVYEAFDQAEYVHPGDPPSFDHETRTREILGELKEEPNQAPDRTRIDAAQNSGRPPQA